MGQRGEWNVRERAISEYHTPQLFISSMLFIKKESQSFRVNNMYLTFIMQCIFLLKEHERIKWHKRQITNS